MAAQLDDLKILDAIVVAVSVLVVHVFGRQEWTTKVLFHHDAVFSASVPLDLHLAVGRLATTGRRKASALVGEMDLRKAGAGTVLRGGQSPSWHPDLFAAREARDLGSRNATTASFSIAAVGRAQNLTLARWFEAFHAVAAMWQKVSTGHNANYIRGYCA